MTPPASRVAPPLSSPPVFHPLLTPLIKFTKLIVHFKSHGADTYSYIPALFRQCSSLLPIGWVCELLGEDANIWISIGPVALYTGSALYT